MKQQWKPYHSYTWVICREPSWDSKTNPDGFKVLQIFIIRNIDSWGSTGTLTGSQMSRKGSQVKHLITVETSLFRPISCLQQKKFSSTCVFYVCLFMYAYILCAY